MADARVRRRRDGPELGDDAVREVLARLPGLRDLLRCAATCKHWRRLVIDRAFLRRLGLWPDTARAPCVLAGVFSQSCYSRDDSRDRGSMSAPPRFLSLQAGLDVHDPLTFNSLVTIDGDDRGLFHLARPLAARRGFLLARVLLPYSPANRDEPKKLHLAVCRPLLDRRSTHLLPPPPFNMDDYLDSTLLGCAIVTAADGTSSLDQKTFQVVLIYKDSPEGALCGCTYSSDSPAAAWTAPVKYYSRASILTRCGPRAGLVTGGGVAHWLFMDDRTHAIYALKVSKDTDPRFFFSKIPIPVHPTKPRPLIPCIAGGKLSFVTIGDDGAADLWTKQEKTWQSSELTNLGKERIGSVFFAETRGALLIEQHGGVLSIVDLNNTKEKLPPVHLKDNQRSDHYSSRGTCRFLESCSSSCCRGLSHGYRGTTCLQTPPVLYEMDWAFTSSSLIDSSSPHQAGSEAKQESSD